MMYVRHLDASINLLRTCELIFVPDTDQREEITRSVGGSSA
jgi:hypothetical protein